MASLGYGFVPTHPGEVIKDELISRKISQREFADRLGLTYSVVNELLNGKRPVTTRTALMVETALGIPAYSLLRLQLKFDMQTARNDTKLKSRLKKIERFSSVLR